jgi:hypothetical protein
MRDAAQRGQRTRGRGLRPLLLQVKFVGLFGFFGGLAALSALGLFGPRPADASGWVLLKDSMRAIFWPCLFGGLVVTILAGLALWLRHPVVFARLRWFRLKVLLLVVCVPLLHLYARGAVTAMYEAIDEERLADAALHWDAVTRAYLITLVVMFAIACVGRVKPRLGEPLGTRRPARSSQE